jgi:hypothetical protein
MKNTNVFTRTCSVSTKKSILFPVINCESNLIEHPEFRTPNEVIDHVTRDENSILKKVCRVDDKEVPVHRVRSDPQIFEIYIDKNGLLDTAKFGHTYATSDGFWVFLKPLPEGRHFISFRGSCEYGRLNSGADYYLNVY